MELRHLRYFVAVAEELHFRRAAERLYIAQPAVSEQIRKLEAELGVRLLNRTNRNVSLTDAGAVMLEEARRVLQQAEFACTAARNAVKQPAMRLRIGYPPAMLPGTVSRALRQLTSSLPNADVAFQTAPALRLIDEAESGRIDVAVVTLPTAASSLRVTPLEPDSAVVALPTGDAHAVEPALALEKLSPDRILTRPRSADPALHDTIVALCRRAGLASTIVEAAEPRLDMLLLAVAAGAGVAILPRWIKEQGALPGIRLIELSGTEDTFEPALLTRQNSPGIPTVAYLRAVASVERARNAGAARADLRLAS
jgi:DNA-binding transcriptional LysR family regulator